MIVLKSNLCARSSIQMSTADTPALVVHRHSQHSQACMQIFEDFYERNWTTPFVDGPQHVAMVERIANATQSRCMLLSLAPIKAKRFRRGANLPSG
jgi:hypothetical protein